ncbi:MAG: family 78 glycoside hydrolase catalytic domain [Bacteroidetes bacterium]|nr:family 78 glycoside hydrolase catalytic domain [Bacteroidota bacterium]
MENLKCESVLNPLGIDNTTPCFSWEIAANDLYDVQQTACQILVASSEEILKKNKADVWDSGMRNSSQSIQVPFEGIPLTSNQRYYWKARVKTNKGTSAYSEASYFEMGMLSQQDWKARWIAAPNVWEFGEFLHQRKTGKDEPIHWDEDAPLLRHEFTCEKAIQSARMYICGVGYYEAYLNGKKVGDHRLDPAFTRYDKRLLYVTYDVTSMLQKENAVGIMLGNGWYNMNSKAVWGFDRAPWRGKPRALMQIEVEYADGSKETIISDDNWKAQKAPVTHNNIRVGMTYDARLEQPGWNTANYDDSKWYDVFEMPSPGGILRAQTIDPIRVFKTFSPGSIKRLENGNYVVDFGQNMAGWISLKATGESDEKISVRYGEDLTSEGQVDQSNLIRHMQENEVQTNHFILKGEGEEYFENKFTYHGFQYVEVLNYPGELDEKDITAHAATTHFEERGHFTCSNELVNKIQHATLWAYMSNFHGYPTDCPHREKNGWTGDAQLVVETGLFNYHSIKGYEKYLDDMADEQRPNGNLSAIIPTSQWGYSGYNGPAWIGAYPIIAWNLYLFNGNLEVLEKHYEGMKKMVDYFSSLAENHILSIGLGDWAPADTKTPVPLTSTVYYYHFADIISQSAALLAYEDDSRQYADLAKKIKKALNAEFYDAKTGKYCNGSQTAQSSPLFFGAVPDEQKQKVIESLIKEIEAKNYHIDAGILGSKYVPQVLAQNGHADIAYRIIIQPVYPGWGNWIERGATTLWEHWARRDTKKHASLNHIMFGDVSNWFYQYIAGIRPDYKAPGFKHFYVEPMLTEHLDWAKADFESAYGTIIAEWKKQNDQITLDVQVPANTSATIILPKGELTNVDVSMFKNISEEHGKTVIKVGSGNYKINLDI